jgi:hypothetical protein
VIRRALVLALALAATTQVGTAHADPVWRTMKAPGLIDQSGFSSVSATAPNKIWAAGYQAEYFYCGETTPCTEKWYFPIVADWNGLGWVPQYMTGASGAMKGIDAITDNDVYATSEGYVGHWNGLWWGKLPQPTAPAGTLHATIAADASGVWSWSSVDADHPAALQRWNGGKWVGYVSDATQITDIADRTPTDVWAVGTGKIVAGAPVTTYLTRWDGSGWHAVAAPENLGTDYLTKLLPVGPNDLWAVSRAGVLFHWNGSGWATAQQPRPASGDVAPVIDGSGGVWAAVKAFASPGQIELLRYDNGAWSLEATPISIADAAVGGMSPIPGTNSIVVVGNSRGKPFIITNG